MAKKGNINEIIDGEALKEFERKKLSQTPAKRRILYALYQAYNIHKHYLNSNTLKNLGENMFKLGIKLGVIQENKGNLIKMIEGNEYSISSDPSSLTTTILSKYTGKNIKTIHYHLKMLEDFSFNEKDDLKNSRQRTALIKINTRNNRKYVKLTDDGFRVCTYLFNDINLDLFNLEDDLQDTKKEYGKFSKGNRALIMIGYKLEDIKNTINDFFSAINYNGNKAEKMLENEKKDTIEKVLLIEKYIESTFESQNKTMLLVFFEGIRTALEELISLYIKIKDLSKLFSGRKKEIDKNIKDTESIVRRLHLHSNIILQNELNNTKEILEEVQMEIENFIKELNKEYQGLVSIENEERFRKNIIKLKGTTQIIKDEIK